MPRSDLPTHRVPAGFVPSICALAVSALFSAASFAQAASAPPATESTPPQLEDSGMSGPLFQQLLIGEIEVREGDLGTGYQLILDAAQRLKNEQLFRRATEIALQGRAGDEALAAVQAWRAAIPQSLEAMRFEAQLLIQLNRSADAANPLRTLLENTPAAERNEAILTLPQFFARTADRNGAAAAIEDVLLPYADKPETRVAARVSIGRAWLAAGNVEKALALAQNAHETDPKAESPAVLAIELMAQAPSADSIVKSQLEAKPDSNGVRLLYVRGLLAAQRMVDATSQLELLTQNAPDLPQAWITLGALQVQLREPEKANAALLKYIALVQARRAPAGGAPAAANGNSSNDDGTGDGTPATQEDALARGYLLLAQLADQQHDFKAADAWLAKIDDPKRAFEVTARRASLLAREGKVEQARALIRSLPEKTHDDARSKVLAEAQVLRDAKLWSAANDVLAKGNQKFPDDADLIYEQSMTAEKLNRLGEMERLLRRVIVLKPDFQQAYNALGYSLAERNMRLPEARTLIKKALELSPGEPSITDSLGWVEYRLGNRDEAVRLLREAYRGQPDAEIGAHLGEVLWVDGQTDAARKVFAEARQRDADNDVLRETLTRLRVGL